MNEKTDILQDKLYRYIYSGESTARTRDHLLSTGKQSRFYGSYSSRNLKIWKAENIVKYIFPNFVVI